MALSFIGGGNQSNQSAGVLRLFHVGLFHTYFEQNQPFTAQLHMAYDIPTRFHKV
jgi:hypothetical protein